MDRSLEDRLLQVIQRRLDQRREEEADAGALQQRRHAREHILAAIPGAYERLRDAVAEINDAVSDAGIHLIQVNAGEVLSLEASFVTAVWPAGEPPAEMHFNINHDGRMTALLVQGEGRVAISSRPVWSADRPFFLDALVALLETH